MITDNAPVIIPAKYLDFVDFFSKKSIAVLPKPIEINIHVIDLEKSRQLSYGSIYSLKAIELKILKIYIKTNLLNGFIWLFKFVTDTLILFDKKINKILWLYFNY